MLKVLSAWWHQPDQFEWFSTYLRARQIASMMRVALVAATVSMTTIGVAMLFSTTPPAGAVGTTLALLGATGSLSASVLWMVRFPTKNQSIAYALVCSVSIGSSALAQSDPSFGILACTAFATISGYIALFHNAWLMTVNLIIVVGVTAIPAVELAARGGVVRASCAYALVLVVNIAVPYGIQFIVHTLGVDLLRADRDPLTGLYRRRAFFQRTAKLVDNGHRDAHLVIAMIDLDRFKELNDTHGHATGDLALAAVGRALREHTRHGAVVGRIGGEEFLVADVFLDRSEEAALGERLCDAIAALPYRITASVGTDGIRCDQALRGDGAHSQITALAGTADAAMYEAKRLGGNQSRQHCAT